MSKQSGISSVLAAAASLLVMGMVVAGSPAQAASEEDLAAPRGAFVSTLAAPAERGTVVTRAGNHPVLIVIGSEEDAAVPPGAFRSAPDSEGEKNVAAAPRNVGTEISLSEIVAASLE